MYLLAYLRGHNNPISGCLKASFQAPLPCARLLQSDTPSEVRVSPICQSANLPPMIADRRIKHSSMSSVFIHPQDMAEPAATLEINTLSNVHVYSLLWSKS